MPGFHIHWKGCPHHRLPRIRVASTPRASIRTRSQLAAEQALRIPLGNALEQARKKHRFNLRFGKRRGRRSRSTSSVAQCRRRASKKARHHIQAFGWGTSQAELASKRTFTPTLRTISAITIIRSGSGTVRQIPPQYSVIPSTDGAASSSVRRAKADTKRTQENRQQPSFPDGSNTPSARRIKPEYVPAGPLGTVRERNSFHGSNTLLRSRTYDPRIDPKSVIEEARSKSGPSRFETTAAARAKDSYRVSVKTKQPSRASTELLEAVSSLVQQTKREASPSVASPSIRTIVPSVPSGNSSRSPSQRKALKKFTREIELYVQACRSLPRGTLEATPSVTTISARTIDDFKPYQEQFQSAGLAVTSDEQRGLIKPREDQSPSTLPKDERWTRDSLVDDIPPPTPPKDKRWSNKNSSTEDTMGLRKSKPKEKPRAPSYASGSTGTTVMAFTPPHEKSSSRPKTERHPSSESDQTIVGFTPTHEIAARPPARPPPSAPTNTTRKSLPWLRKPDSEAVSPTKKMSAPPETEKPQPSTPLEGWVGCEAPSKKEKMPDKSKNSVPEVPPRPVSKLSTNLQWKELSYSGEEVPAKPSEPLLEENLAQPGVETDPVQLTTETITDAIIQLSSSTSPVPGPFQSPPAKRSPIKSRAQEQPGEKDSAVRGSPMTVFPTQQEFEPSLCTMCAGKLTSSTTEPESQPELLSEQEPAPGPKPPGLCHTCTSRPSLICGQCSPSPQGSAVISPIQTSPWERPSRRSTRDIIPTGPVSYTKEPTNPPKVEHVIVCQHPEEMFMPVQIVKEVLLDYTDPPIPDPTKQPSVPRLKLKTTASQPLPQKKQYSTTSRPSPRSYVPQPPTVVYVPTQIPDLAANSSRSVVSPKPDQVTDRQVFKGLHVATAAACDDDVDKWIEEITGSGVRKFLADLSCFEGLGVNTLADVAKRAAKQRRERVRAWEVIREARVIQRDTMKEDCSAQKETGESCVEKQIDGQVDWVVGDMGVVARDEESQCRVVHARDCRKSEDVRTGY